MVDLEWNRKTISEKLDWLKELLEDVIAKANHNISIHQEQLHAVIERLAALEKPVGKPASVRKSAPPKKSTPVKAVKTKRAVHVPARRAKQSPPSSRKR